MPGTAAGTQAFNSRTVFSATSSTEACFALFLPDIAMLGFSLALFLMPQISLAEEDHIAEAIMHTKQAIDHGKQGHADVLTTHAEAALTHAEAGEKVKANAHTEEGITHLKQAIEEGKKGNAKMATTHAEAALTHLEQVK